jgi:nucleotide-binding universal stress UspA family protein
VCHENEGVRVHCHVLRGSDVSGIIEQQARSYGASVIVMSTHGRTGIGRLLLGSVASDVVKRTDLPVILVRPGEEPRPA